MTVFSLKKPYIWMCYLLRMAMLEQAFQLSGMHPAHNWISLGIDKPLW